MSWLWEQSGLVYAAIQQWQCGRGLVPFTRAQESSPGWSLFEDSPLVAAAGRDGHMEQAFMPFLDLQEPLGMFP